MNVYSVTVNKNDYCRLEFCEDYDGLSKIPVEEEGFPTDWNPPPCKYIDVEKPMADFTALSDYLIVYDFEGIDEDTEPECFINSV